MTIETSSGLSEEEVARMKDDAEQHAGEDRKRREAVDTKNQAEQMAYQIEKTLKEHESKIDAAGKAEVEAKVKALREKAEGDDIGAIKSAMADLEQAMHKVSQNIYQGAEQAGGQPSAETAAGAKTGEGGGEEDIKDADFEVK